MTKNGRWQNRLWRKIIFLKELYTSETTLAQKIVLAPLNNEFRFKNSYSTSFMLKNPPEFLKKIHKNQFSASWRGLMVFIYIYKLHHNRTTLNATDFCRFFSKILAEIFSMKEVVFQIINLNSLFRGVNTFFWAQVVSEV